MGSLELTFLDFFSFGHGILGRVCREGVDIRRPLVWCVVIDQHPLRTLREDEKGQKGKEKTIDAKLFEDSLLVLDVRVGLFSTDPRDKKGGRQRITQDSLPVMAQRAPPFFPAQYEHFRPNEHTMYHTLPVLYHSTRQRAQVRDYVPTVQHNTY